ncbi:MAG: hypothetical protein QME96_01285 [Myxococcota bacterium]|nr:hypothetical protein [Myxococcota bacterium]
MGVRATREMLLVVAALAASMSASVEAQETRVRGFGAERTPRSLGLADAAVASGISTTGVFLNPAGVGMGSVFHTEAWYGFANDLDRHVFGVVAVDSTTPIAGGLGFAWAYTGLPAEESNFYDARAVLALPLARIAAIGVNMRYVRVDYAEAIPHSPGALNDFTLDAGGIVQIDRFFLGVVGTNLTDLDHPLAPLALIVGAGMALGPGRLEFDAAFDWSSYDEVEPMGVKYAIGGEVLLLDVLVLRAGYRYEDIPDVHGIGAGIGYVDRHVALDFGFQQDLSGDRSDTRLGLSARYFVR